MNNNIKLLIKLSINEEDLFDNVLDDDNDELEVSKHLGIYLTNGIDNILYDAVDLDLPSGNCWATLNIGSEKPEEYGCYFLGNKKPVGFYKNKTKLPSDCIYAKTWYKCQNKDMATYYIGNHWYTPSKEDIVELVKNTKFLWVKLGRIYGMKFSSLKDPNKSIFIPASGYKTSGPVSEKGIYCMLWSSTKVPDDALHVYHKTFAFKCNKGLLFMLQCSEGFKIPIRPIYKK